MLTPPALRRGPGIATLRVQQCEKLADQPARFRPNWMAF